jgi:hypothetical protein
MVAFQPSAISFPAGTPLTRRSGSNYVERRHIAAVARQPAQDRHQLRCQLDALGIDGKTVVVNPALTGYHIQVAAGSLGVEDRAALVLNFFKTTVAAASTERFPFFV